MSKTAAEGQSVLIVGAGPVGMVLACELLRAGVDVTIIAKQSHRQHTPHSRATILWPRILELLDRIGVAEALVADGHYFDQMNYYSGKRRIGRIRFDRLRGVSYPFAITIPQWKTEEILERHLRGLGGSVHYGHEFTGGAIEDDRVSATINVEGHARTMQFDWLIGADGYSSRVRDVFGFNFTGHALRTKLAITDAELIGEHTTSEAAYYLTRGGNMVLAPLGGGIFRVGASVPAGNDSPVVDREFFESLLRQRVPGVKSLGHMNFSGVFTANIRSTSSYRNDRVFLVGDAAHAMSPSGAQGLNTGLQDAVNLGWKLAGVTQGRYPVDMLDSYDSERRPAVDSVSKLSTRLAHISLYSSPAKIIARDTAYRIGSVTNALESILAPRLAQLDTSYGLKTRRGGLVAGQRLPLGWKNTPAAPVLAIDSYTVLLWPGHSFNNAAWSKWVDATRDAIGDEVTIRDLAGNPLGDLGSRLPSTAAAVIARPDGHIAAVVSLDIGDTTMSIAALWHALPDRTRQIADEKLRPTTVLVAK